MRMLATFLIVIAAIYFWDVQYNDETLGWSPRHGAVHLAQFRMVANSAHFAE